MSDTVVGEYSASKLGTRFEGRAAWWLFWLPIWYQIWGAFCHLPPMGHLWVQKCYLQCGIALQRHLIVHPPAVFR